MKEEKTLFFNKKTNGFRVISETNAGDTRTTIYKQDIQVLLAAHMCEGGYTNLSNENYDYNQTVINPSFFSNKVSGFRTVSESNMGNTHHTVRVHDISMNFM